MLTKTNQQKLTQIQGEIERKFNQSLEQNLKSFEEVQKSVGQLQSTAQRMVDSTKSVDKLNSIFERTSSKAFGNFGESYLESMFGATATPRPLAKTVSD